MTAAENGNWYMVTHDGAATLCVDEADAQEEAKKADREWPRNGPHRAVRLVEASFEAADMATASAQGFRDGEAAAGATIATLKGQRAVLCSLLGECRGHLEDAAHAMHMVEEEMPVWDLVERIESALKAISEDQVKVGES